VNKVAHYLQQHISGEVLTSPDVLDHFATDESIIRMQPLLVAHPRSENDLRKVARFSWQLSERGRTVPITIRGKGTDQTGAGIGDGIMLSTPAHMNKIIELDPKSGSVTVQAGINAGKLQQALHTHGRWLPSLHDSMEYTTIGGAVANNEAGPTSYKYGPIREHVTGLRVVLANGELIQTKRLSKRELNKKLGLASFEGELYRSLDKLIEESSNELEMLSKSSDRSNVGYALQEVKSKDGSFDLTPLFVGAQGTLGLISEITLATEVHNPDVELLVALFSSREEAFLAVEKINSMKQGPAALDFIDSSVITYVQEHNPSLYKHTFGSETPEIAFFLYLEASAGLISKRSRKQLVKTLEDAQAEVIDTKDKRDNWEAALASVSTHTSSSHDNTKPVPVIRDAYVPVTKMAEFLDEAGALIKKYSAKSYAFWGQAGSGIVHAAPSFDIATVGDRQKMFKLLDEYYTLVTESDGSIAASSSEGRLMASQLHKEVTEDVLNTFRHIKKIFDPYNMLNPGVKLGTDIEALKPMVRNEYSTSQQYVHISRG
jgi:FAD/FMN-containing dehydrogenase